MFAPKIHESTLPNTVAAATSTQVSVQSDSASGLSSILPVSVSATCRMASVIHSTWASIVGGRLVNAPLGPRIMNMFGKPLVVMPA